MILLDTSGLLAWIDARQTDHRQTVEAMRHVEPPYLLSPFVLAELDHLISTRVGPAEQYALLAEVASGAFRLVDFKSDQVSSALSVIRKYADFQIGLADASLVVLADTFKTRRILTLDERHFRVLRGADQRPFEIFPIDHKPEIRDGNG